MNKLCEDIYMPLICKDRLAKILSDIPALHSQVVSTRINDGGVPIVPSTNPRFVIVRVPPVDDSQIAS
jgi:hypothetical protein